MTVGSVNQYTSAQNVMSQFSSSVNIPEMGMLIQMERNNILQGQVQDQFKDMQKRNEWLKNATEALNTLRKERPTNTTDTLGLSRMSVDGTDLETYFRNNGIAYPPRALNQADFDTCISNLKASIDTVNTNSQLDMVRMQGLMDKLNQTVDFMTNWTSKNSKTMDNIMGGFR